MPYNEVQNDLNTTITNYDYPDIITMSLTVDEYNENDSTKENILKPVTIEAKYKVFNSEQIYKVKKLKIKEI